MFKVKFVNRILIHEEKNDKIVEASDINVFGLTDFDDYEIILYSYSPPFEKTVILFHELIHMLIYYFTFKYEGHMYFQNLFDKYFTRFFIL